MSLYIVVLSLVAAHAHIHLVQQPIHKPGGRPLSVVFTLKSVDNIVKKFIQSRFKCGRHLLFQHLHEVLVIGFHNKLQWKIVYV